MSINMNDFGGKNEHLMNHRYFNNRDRKYQIDWKYWAKQVKKDETWNSLKEYIKPHGRCCMNARIYVKSIYGIKSQVSS